MHPKNVATYVTILLVGLGFMITSVMHVEETRAAAVVLAHVTRAVRTLVAALMMIVKTVLQ